MTIDLETLIAVRNIDLSQPLQSRAEPASKGFTDRQVAQTAGAFAKSIGKGPTLDQLTARQSAETAALYSKLFGKGAAPQQAAGLSTAPPTPADLSIAELDAIDDPTSAGVIAQTPAALVPLADEAAAKKDQAQKEIDHANARSAAALVAALWLFRTAYDAA